MATISRVFARRSSRSTSVASASDFLSGGARAIDLGTLFELEPARLSPYAFDVDRGSVTFVRTWPDIDLVDAHPFFYAAQRVHARELVTAEFDEVHAVADSVHVPDFRLAFLYSAGRSGSTVVGRLAACLPDVQAVSEPDVFAHVALARHPGDVARDVELVRVARSLGRLLARHRIARHPDRRTLLLKQRGMGVFGASLVHLALPEARALHLVRDPADVVDSYVATFLRQPVLAAGRRLGLDRLAVRAIRAVVGLTHPWIPRAMPNVVAAAPGSRDGAVEVLALAVRAMNDEIGRLAAEGAVELNARLRYERLMRSPDAFARELAHALGIANGPSLDGAIRHAVQVASTDAQHGSSVASRGVRALNASDVARVHATFTERTEAAMSGRAA